MITDGSLETVSILKAPCLVKLMVLADVLAFNLFFGNVKLPTESSAICSHISIKK